MRKNSEILFIILIFVLSSLLFSQETENPESASEAQLRPFRIGFMLSDTEPAADLGWFRGLKNFLMDQESIEDSLMKEGYSGIVVLPADGYRDMLQRMDLKEFDLVLHSPNSRAIN